MATTTSTKTGIPSFDTAFEQVRESSEQVLAAARKAGNLYLDSYEKAVDRTTELARVGLFHLPRQIGDRFGLPDHLNQDVIDRALDEPPPANGRVVRPDGRQRGLPTANCSPDGLRRAIQCTRPRRSRINRASSSRRSHLS